MLVLLLLAGVASEPISKTFATSNSLDDIIFCENWEIIPLSKQCDGTQDCSDGSDEENCEIITCKSPDFFKCTNHHCISSLFVCDGENHCEDFSDESNCQSSLRDLKTTKYSTCGDAEWQCTEGLCIPKEWVCDGERNCEDGSDEILGCSVHIHCDGFQCRNGHCIHDEWRCDGVDDCGDQSDEEECDALVQPQDCTLENERYLCADGKTCIHLDQLCDDTATCSDNSDEGTFCKKDCEDCKHRCVKLPNGPKCLCPKGYRTVGSKGCEDINECEIYGICDHKCKNRPGSYECFCEPHYSLQEDNRTCKGHLGEATMFFSNNKEIRGYLLRSQVYFSVVKDLEQAVGVDFDGKHVYWIEIFSERESIVRAMKNGEGREVVVSAGLAAPEDLHVDYATGNLYFTDTEKQHIKVCSHDGGRCAVLVNEKIEKPRGIVLDPKQGDMYWTDWGHIPQIAHALMDGSNRSSFVNTDIHWPNGLALDRPNSRLYWTDAKLRILESIRLDGTQRRVVLKDVVRHPYAVAIYENRLYWSDWETLSIHSCDKFTGKNRKIIAKEKDYIFGITIYHPRTKQFRSNICHSAGCSDICLLRGPDGYSCACAEGRELGIDGRTCRDIEKTQRLVVGSGAVLATVCKDKEFRCISGACIPRLYECDGDFDCEDFSDEHSDCHSCPDHTFTCTNKQCVDKSFVCDGDNDCGDNTDEFYCIRFTTASPCPHPNDFVCSLHPLKCVPTAAQCNGTSECGDSSDESPLLCYHTLNSTAATPCSAPNFQCKIGPCIPPTQVCDGKDHCFDGSDEDGACSTSCVAMNNPCDHRCIPTPTGPMCDCDKGYRLSGDGKSCHDVDECAADPCAQICLNSIGSYMCNCSEGFELRWDKTGCKAEGKAMRLVFVKGGQIREMSQMESALRLVYGGDEAGITGLEVATETNSVFFSVEVTGTIVRIDRESSKTEFLEEVGRPTKLSLDWLTKNIYYINNDPLTKSIAVCNFQQKACSNLITVDNHRQVSSLVVDSINKHIFYSLVSWWMFNTPNYVIYKANLDGTNIQEVVKTTSGYIIGLTYNPHKKHLYFLDHHASVINRIDYEGKLSNRLYSNISKPMGLAYFEDHLFFQTNGDVMKKCKVYAAMECTSFRWKGEMFVVAQESRQPIGANPCGNHSCEYFCVQGKEGFKCVCEDWKVVGEGEECGSDKKESGSDGHRKIIIAVVAISICILVFGGILFLRAKKRDSGTFSMISIRYLKPRCDLQASDDAHKAILQRSQHEHINSVEFFDAEDGGKSKKEEMLVSV